MSPSLSTLPGLSEPYSVLPEAIESDRRDGRVPLRGAVLPEEGAAYRSRIAEAVARYRRATRPLEVGHTYGQAVPCR